VNLQSFGASVRVAIIVGVGALALAACSSDADAAANKAAEALPDLSSQGLTSFECGTGEAVGGTFQKPEAPYKAECWTGSPDTTFLDIANASQDAVILATGGTDVTAEACQEDAFGDGGGIACRAVLVTEGDSTVLVRTVVVLTDPNAVIAELPENPTTEQVNEALTGAPLEVLVGTEPTASAAPSPNPTDT